MNWIYLNFHLFTLLQGSSPRIFHFFPGSLIQIAIHWNIKIRVMPDYIIITTQNTRELWGCAEGLSVAGVNRPKMNQWPKAFPGALNDTGDVPVIKRGDGRFA
ncbi:hypothetical protein ROK90_14030 [Cronobacter dublinensis]|uniref:hypothetical protein n=1 Tax=Cronobacter dublinensis TaxID=413497 RepID=UPI0023DD4846|nr:hypothetical protein [Cronobacter dublinensis]MDT3667119.1 hypothetical protein [Cronobacter dublinensis]WEP47665.1 hypothetical protein NNQ27_21880 [Cronobacter dublinensis]